MNDLGLGTLVTFNPSSVQLDTPLAELAQRLLDCGFHHWPVVDRDRRVVGIISDVDVTRHFSASASAHALDRAANVSPLRDAVALDIMSSRVATIDLSTPWRDALATLVEQQVHSLPVVDDGVLVGIVTSSDFLREFSQGELPGSRDPVAAAMTKTTETIEADADLELARSLMLASGQTHLVVVKGECPLGVISRRMLHKARCAQLVREAMGSSTIEQATYARQLVRTAPTVKPGDRLATAAQLMVDFGVQAVAVVNQAHRMLGVVSDDDLLRAMLAGDKEQNSRRQEATTGYFRTCSK
jgi:CBS domain-containing protein